MWNAGKLGHSEFPLLIQSAISFLCEVLEYSLKQTLIKTLSCQRLIWEANETYRFPLEKILKQNSIHL